MVSKTDHAQLFKRRAAAYVRMSTDQQDQSIPQQLNQISQYADCHALDVVRIYKDEGVSGLTARHRKGLQQLIDNVTGGSPGFDVLLVSDVSRWGRFQDIDESAYYEFLCWRAGIPVLYCAEPFTISESPLGHLMKDIKHLMAAEHSRQLSAKIFDAHSYLLKRGYKPGGVAGYGFVRICLRADGSVRRVLEKGERKSHPTDRVVLGEGAAEEVEIVRRIFKWYVDEHLTYQALAQRLNEAHIPSPSTGMWLARHVRGILTSPKYCGTLVYNRTTGKLGKNRTKNSESKWIRCESAHPALVKPHDFENSKATYRLRHGLAPEETLAAIRRIYLQHGRLTYRLIEAEPGIPHGALIKKMFGSFYRAYQLAAPDAFPASEAKGAAHTALLQEQLLTQVWNCVVSTGHKVQATSNRMVLRLDDSVLLRLSVVRCKRKAASWGWLIPASSSGTDFVLSALLDSVNGSIRAYTLLDTRSQRVENKWLSVRAADNTSIPIYSSIEALFGQATNIRTTIAP